MPVSAQPSRPEHRSKRWSGLWQEARIDSASREAYIRDIHAVSKGQAVRRPTADYTGGYRHEGNGTVEG